VDLLNEVLDHLLGDVNVGNHPVAERTDNLDVPRRLAHHELGVIAHGLDALHAVDRLDRDHRRFIEDDTATPYVNDCVRRTEIDRHVLRQRLEPTREKHVPARLLEMCRDVVVGGQSPLCRWNFQSATPEPEACGAGCEWIAARIHAAS
jgi:hypothetical protein